MQLAVCSDLQLPPKLRTSLQQQTLRFLVSVYTMYQSTEAAVTKFRQLGGLNNRHAFSRSSRDWRSKIKVPAGLGSAESSVFGLQMAAFSLYPHIVFPWSVRAGRVTEKKRERDPPLFSSKILFLSNLHTQRGA